MKPNKVLALLFFGVLMGALDISIVGPAIPSITETIKVAQKDLSWIFNIYVLFNLLGISLFAKLSDLYGRRRIYMITLSIFGAGSLIVSIAPDFTTLLIGRAIQGFGASGIFPVASAVVGDIFPPEKRGRALGMIGAVWGIAFILGPIIAGVLLSFFEWHVLFLINIPVVLVLLFFSSRLLANESIESPGDIDWRGIILLGLFLVSFTFGASHIDLTKGWDSLFKWQTGPFLIAALILLPILFLAEMRAKYPVINTRLFNKRQIRIVGLIALITGLFQSAFVFIPNLAVQSFGIKASTASFMLLPFVTATAIGSPLFGRMLDKTGSRIVVMTGLVLSATGMILLGLSGGSKVLFYGSGILIGLGLAVLAGSALRYIMLNEVSVHERAVTQGVLTILISVGQIVGSAAIAGISASGSTLMAGYHTAFFTLAVVMGAAFVAALRLKGRSEEKALVPDKQLQY